MTTPARYFAVYIGTTNDTNGNPRRGWIVHEPGNDGAGVRWVEEGYSGVDALYRAVAGPPQKGETYGDSHGSTNHMRDMTNRHYTDRARSLVYETGRINVTPGEYRDARKLPRFGGAK